MTLEFLPEASSELYSTAEYYESKQEGLGWRFREAWRELKAGLNQAGTAIRRSEGSRPATTCGFDNTNPIFNSQGDLLFRSAAKMLRPSL